MDAVKKINILLNEKPKKKKPKPGQKPKSKKEKKEYDLWQSKFKHKGPNSYGLMYDE